MLTHDERRIRYRECLEMEAQYGQLLPCENHDDLDHLAMVGSAPGDASGQRQPGWRIGSLWHRIFNVICPQ
jgi:hypothetical protein